MKRTILICMLALLLLVLLDPMHASAQCAMCRMQVENNVSSGETSVGAGLNKGIMFLLSMPYLLFAVITYFWYRQSRQENEKRIQGSGYYRG